MNASQSSFPCPGRFHRPTAFALLTGWLVVGLTQLQGADPIRYLGGTTFLTTTELTISPDTVPQVIGTMVTLTSNTRGVLFPGANVSFYVDGTLIGTAPTDASTKASLQFDTSLLTEGTHRFRAEFPVTVTATRQTGTHVVIFDNNVFAGYFDIYERDLAAPSSGQVSQQFLKGVSLTASHRGAHNSFQFSFTGSTEWDYPIEVSTNLLDWTLLTKLSPEGGPTVVADTETDKNQKRYFRIRATPRKP